MSAGYCEQPEAGELDRLEEAQAADAGQRAPCNRRIGGQALVQLLELARCGAGAYAPPLRWPAAGELGW